MRKTKAKYLWPFALAVLVMLLLAVPFWGQPASANEYHHSEHITKWTATSGTVSENCYYLADDVNATGNITVEGTVDLCLNGHTLDLGDCSISPATGATLNICDCGKGGEISSSGIAIAINSSLSDGNINIYSGNIKGSTAINGIGSGTIAIYGGTVYGSGYGIMLDEGCVLALNGGSVSGGSMSAITVSSGSVLSISGGSVKSDGDVGIRLSNGSVSLSGAPSISGGVNKDDMRLADGMKINISGELTYTDGPISVLLADKATFPYLLTDGWADCMEGKDYNTYFEASGSYVYSILDETYKLYKLNDEGDGGELQFVGHTHSWEYAVDPDNRNRVIATCNPENGDNLYCTNKNGGSFTVSLPSDLLYDGNAKTVTVDYEETLFTGDELSVSYTNEAGESITPKAVGTYTATVTVMGDENTPFSWDFTITYLDPETVPDAELEGDGTYVEDAWWYKGDITLKAPTGYEIFTSPVDSSDDMQTEITISEDMNGDFVYYLKDTATGKYAEKTATLRRDTKKPVLESHHVSDETDVSCTIKLEGTDGTDGVGIEEYRLFYWIGTDEQNAQEVKNASGIFTLENLLPHTTYTFAAALTDKLGNEMARWNLGTFTTVQTDITNAKVTVSGKYVYNGSALIPMADQVTVMLDDVVIDPAAYTVSVAGNIAVGTATVTVTAKEGGSYSGKAVGTFTIEPCSLINAITALETTSVTYNGKQQNAAVSVTANGTTLAAGTDYTVIYLRGQVESSDLIHVGELTVKIVGCGNYTGEVTVGTYSIVQAGITVTANDQFIPLGGSIQNDINKVTVSGLADGDRLASVMLTQNGHYTKPSAVQITDASGADVTANYLIGYTDGKCHTLAWSEGAYQCTVCGEQQEEDAVAPTGTLTLTDSTESFTSNKLFANITFSQFSTKDLVLTVTATDDHSGLASISYYIANQTIPEGNLPSLVWRTYPAEGVTIPAEAGKQVAVYIRLTDHAGNVSYLSADRGIIFDLEAPKVEGVTNGETYYVTQQVTLQDAISGLRLGENNCGWDAASLLGLKTASLTLIGNTEATYEFYLYDVAGNTAGVYKVTMKPIAALSADIDHLTLDTVTALDMPLLQQVLAKVTGIKNTSPYATEAEKAALQGIIDKCNELLEKVQDTEAMLIYFGDLLAGYDVDTVTSADRTDIDFIRESINTLAGGNVTEEQREQLAELSRKADLLLARIDEVAAELQRLREEAGKYDITTVTTEDREPLETLKRDIEALLAGTNLTAAERTELEELYKKVSTILDEVWKIADEIARLTELLDAYTIPTVKSSDKAAIEALAIEIDDLLNSTGLTAEEQSALQALADKATALLNKIKEVASEINRLSLATSRYNINTVTTQDIPALKALQADILALLGGDNLTSEERAAVISLRLTVDALLARAEGIASELARITDAINGYDPAKVGPSDRQAIEALIADIDDLLTSPNLLEEEKTALAELREKANDLLDAIDRNGQNMTGSLLEALYGYDIDTVKSVDQTPIEQLLHEIRALLETDLPSEEDRVALDDAIPYAEALLAEIQKNLDELARLIAAANAYDINTVKSTDREAIVRLLVDMYMLAAPDHLTDSEREQMEEASAIAAALLARIEEAAKAPITENTNAAADLDQNNYALTDKATLEQAKADIEKALADYEGNYTEEEKAALRAEITRIEGLLHSIARVEAVQSAIGLIPEDANIKDNDVAAAVDMIVDAYNQLTNHEKELVDRSRLDELLGITEGYAIISGRNNTWQKGSDYALSFGANGEFSKFTGVKVDGVLLEAEHYIAVARDTVVNLAPTYLETLDIGSHTLTILYTDGEASCSFTITAAGQKEGNSYLWLIILIIVLCLIGGAVAVYIVMKKERNTGRR